MSQLTKEQIEAQKKEDMQLFEKEITNVSQKLPSHSKKEFTFTALERQLLAQQATIEALAKNAQEAIINEVCLKRLNVTPSQNIHIRYSVGLGRFVVFAPKS